MSHRPVVVIQGAASADPLPGITAIASEAVLRFADSAAGLEEALPGADVLLGWRFDEAGLATMWSRADRLRWQLEDR